MKESLPPVERTTIVPWTPSEAFERFTAQFGQWWPVSTHSIGGKLVRRVVFECYVGGRIFEEFEDGRRFQWGRVTVWEPPGRVAFTWHPSRDESVAQNVELRFEAVGNGSRVVLTSSGWEKLGTRAGRARKAYSIGWGAVLDVFAGRRSMPVAVFAIISHAATFILKATGRLEREITKAGGRMQS